MAEFKVCFCFFTVSFSYVLRKDKKKNFEGGKMIKPRVFIDGLTKSQPPCLLS